jgi:CheY-like chemotaxis protein
MARILIIEDEKSLNQAYETVLNKAGHDVKAVANGQEALEAFSEQVPELVLLDLRMPKMNGVEFLKKLKPADNYPKTKIVIFSNYDDQSEIDAAFKHGANRYILKAWSTPQDLTKTVREVLAAKK